MTAKTERSSHKYSGALTHRAARMVVLGDVWLDFDPAALVTTGLDVDDDLALLALLALQRRGRLNLVGVSITAGNAALRDTLDNARRLLQLTGTNIEPAPGAVCHGVLYELTAADFEQKWAGDFLARGSAETPAHGHHDFRFNII